MEGGERLSAFLQLSSIAPLTTLAHPCSPAHVRCPSFRKCGPWLRSTAVLGCRAPGRALCRRTARPSARYGGVGRERSLRTACSAGRAAHPPASRSGSARGGIQGQDASLVGESRFAGRGPLPAPAPGLPGASVSAVEELEQFDRIKRALNNKYLYGEFLKCLNLFSHEIISKYVGAVVSQR